MTFSSTGYTDKTVQITVWGEDCKLNFGLCVSNAEANELIECIQKGLANPIELHQALENPSPDDIKRADCDPI